MKIEYPTRQHIGIYSLLFVLLIFLTPRAGYVADVDFWQRWTTYIFNHGLGNIYEFKDNNYPPLFHYFLFAFGKLLGSVEKIARYRHFIKLLVLPFDFAGALLAAWLFAQGDRNQRFNASLLLLCNVAFVYNTVIWEQVDALFSCLVFGAVVLALRQRVTFSMVCMVLAINAKTQSIIFLPPLLLLWIPLWWRTPRSLLLGAAVAASMQIIILVPFIWGGNHNNLSQIVQVVLHGVDFYPYVSMNAHNWWAFWLPGNTLDKIRFAGMTYKQWGLMGFALASAAALLPLAKASWGKLRQGGSFGADDYAPVLLSLGLVPLVFTYFNTQMHERYWHAALLFLAAYGFFTGRYFLYGLFSLAYLLNLEAVMQYLGLKHYGVVVFSAILGTPLFTIVIVNAFFHLYKLTVRTTGWALPWAASGRQPIGNQL